MTNVEFHPDHRGVGEMLRSDFIQRTVNLRAEDIRMRAFAMAPVDEDSPHPGRYKASFAIRTKRRGGATHDRAEAIVYNDSPEAFWVEFGHWGEEPHHTLAHAAFERR